MYPDFEKNEREGANPPDESTSGNYEFPAIEKGWYSSNESVRSEPTYNEQNYAESAYSQSTQEDSSQSTHQEAPWNVYSPSVFTNLPDQRLTPTPITPPAEPRVRKKRLGRFFRAACLVIVCSLFSGLAAFAVIEYRFNSGDLAINNQVILGGGVAEARPEAPLVTEPVAVVGDGMSAEDIYSMAISQVVGISVHSPAVQAFDSSENQIPATGSGFIISTDGYILTNYHVIEIAHFHNLPVSVVMFDGTTHEAQIVGFEPDNDVALLKINANDLNPVFIGNSNDLRVGQRVYAVGNPFGDLLHTMTDGIVSALDRIVTVDGRSIHFFQTSAAVNRGNSGGPVYNTNGEVIGIVTAKVVRGNAEGIGFAIPINDAIEIATELIEHGYLAGRPLIGITGQTVSGGDADHFDWVVGALIRDVLPDSAAEIAGIEVGDIITALGNVEVDSMFELREALREYSAGDTTTITVWRDGERHTLSITFDEDMAAGIPRPPMREPTMPNPFADIDLP